MRRTTPSSAARTAATALLLLALGACGSETADPAAGPDADEPFDVGAATLTDEPFCGQVEPATVAGVLGLPADKVKVQVDREVGEEFEGAVEEAGPSISVTNLCVLGTGTSQFLVSVQPDATADDVQESIDDLAGLAGEGSSERCTASEAAGFGDPAAAYTCKSDPPLERRRVVVTGLVGGSKFFCSSIVNVGAGDRLSAATLDACRAMLEKLATEA